MNVDKIRSLAQEIIAECDKPNGADKIIDVKAGTRLQSVIDSAPLGSTLRLESATYEGVVNIRQSLSIIPAIPVPDGRAKKAFQPVILISNAQTLTVQPEANAVSLLGLSLKSTDNQQQVFEDLGTEGVFDRLVVLGDSVRGQHRGIAPHGKSAKFRDCFADDCFLVGRDAQAMSGYNGTDGLDIDNCYLGGGGQSLMFGGGGGPNAASTPKNIRVRRTDMGKNPVWFSLGAQIKCAFELKNVENLTMEDCTWKFAGNSEGQGSFLVVLSPRDDNGKNPWTAIRNVTIERCSGSFGGSCILFLGTDTNHPTGLLEDVSIRNVLFTDIDPKGITKGRGRCLEFSHGPKNILLDSITIKGQNLNSVGYFSAEPPTGGIKNIVQPASTYGWKIDGGGQGLAAVKAYAPNFNIEITPNPSGATGVPSFPV